MDDNLSVSSSVYDSYIRDALNEVVKKFGDSTSLDSDYKYDSVSIASVHLNKYIRNLLEDAIKSQKITESTIETKTSEQTNDDCISYTSNVYDGFLNEVFKNVIKDFFPAYDGISENSEDCKSDTISIYSAEVNEYVNERIREVLADLTKVSTENLKIVEQQSTEKENVEEIAVNKEEISENFEIKKVPDEEELVDEPNKTEEDPNTQFHESDQRLFGTQTETHDLNEETPKTPSHSESSSRMSSQLSFYIQSIIEDSVKSEATKKAASKNLVNKKRAKVPSNRIKKPTKAKITESTPLGINAQGLPKTASEKHLQENKNIQVNFSRCNSSSSQCIKSSLVTRSMESKSCQTDEPQITVFSSSRASSNLDEMSHVSRFIDPMIRRYYFNEIKLLKRRTNHFTSYDEAKFVEYSKAISHIDSIFSVGTNGYVKSRISSALNHTDSKILQNNTQKACDIETQKEINCEHKPKILNSGENLLKNSITSEYLLNRKRQPNAFGTLVKTPRIFLGCGRLTQTQENKLIGRLTNKQSNNKLLKTN